MSKKLDELIDNALDKLRVLMIKKQNTIHKQHKEIEQLRGELKASERACYKYNIANKALKLKLKQEE